jgi:hypothetical protein
MKHVIILKGQRNSGKSTTLRQFVPPEFGYPARKRSFYYREKRLLIISSSIHERTNWRVTIDRMLDTDYDFFIAAAWLDEMIMQGSVHRTLEDILQEEAPGMFNCVEVFTELKEPTGQHNDHKRCALEIKQKVDAIIDQI